MQLNAFIASAGGALTLAGCCNTANLLSNRATTTGTGATSSGTVGTGAGSSSTGGASGGSTGGVPLCAGRAPTVGLSCAGSVSFSAAGSYAIAGSPNGLAVGDLDCDGAPDVVLSNFDASSIDVFLNAGDGTFAAPASYALPGLPALTGEPGAAPEEPTIADVNGDGWPDVLVAIDPGEVAVLLNSGDGDGTLGAPAFYATGGGNVFSVAVGDLDGDGRPDLAGATSNVHNAADDSAVYVLHNAGAGTFSLAGTYPTLDDEPWSAVIADLDGDGKPDLVVSHLYDGPLFDGGSGGGTIGILLNQGGGKLGTEALTATGNNAFQLAVADLNRDGLPDLAVASNGPGPISVLLQQTEGRFAPAVLYPAGVSPTYLAAAILVQGGAPALVVSDVDGAALEVLENQGGEGTFGLATAVTLDGGIQQPSFMAIADFNHDGIPDLAWAFTSGVTLFFGQCN